MHSEGHPVMSAGLERIAAPARHAPQRCLTRLAHPSAAARLWRQRWHVPRHTASGRDGQPGDARPQACVAWRAAPLRALQTQGDRPPPGRRPAIPQPGKPALRPLGGPCIGDRVRPRRGADVLLALDEQAVLPGSCGGRPGLGAPPALATVPAVSAGQPVRWRSETDRRPCFGSVAHAWLWRFVPHRIGAPRRVRLSQRGLTAGGLADGSREPSAEGVPPGGSRSVVLRHLSLPDGLALWCERVGKPRRQGAAPLLRSMDACVVGLQSQTAAPRFEQVLGKRLARVALA